MRTEAWAIAVALLALGWVARRQPTTCPAAPARGERWFCSEAIRAGWRPPWR